MALFRFHRGSLEESLKTTIIVKTFNDMVKAIVFSDLVVEGNPPWGARFAVEEYGPQPDKRCGWFTHIVTTNLYKEDEMHPIGFLSEPFE